MTVCIRLATEFDAEGVTAVYAPFVADTAVSFESLCGITLPNQASVFLHESMDFETVGAFHEAGDKFDAWHDVAWLPSRQHPRRLRASIRFAETRVGTIARWLSQVAARALGQSRSRLRCRKGKATKALVSNSAC